MNEIKEMYMDDLHIYDGRKMATYKGKRAIKGILHYLTEPDEGHEMASFEFIGESEETGTEETANMELGSRQRVRIKGKDYILRKRNL